MTIKVPKSRDFFLPCTRVNISRETPRDSQGVRTTTMPQHGSRRHTHGRRTASQRRRRSKASRRGDRRSRRVALHSSITSMGDKWKNGKFRLLSECTNWRNTLRYVVGDGEAYWAIDVEALGPNPLFPSAAKLHSETNWGLRSDEDRAKWKVPKCYQPILRFKLQCVGATGAFDPHNNNRLPTAYELTNDGFRVDSEDKGSTPPPALDDALSKLFRHKEHLTQLETILNHNIGDLLDTVFKQGQSEELKLQREGDSRKLVIDKKLYEQLAKDPSSPLGF